jgi:hypothetical protein
VGKLFVLFFTVLTHGDVTGQSIRFQAFIYQLYNQSTVSFFNVDKFKASLIIIIAFDGLKARFKVKQAKIPNAVSVIYESKKYILYHPTFVSSLNKSAGNQWASVSILCS